MGRAYSDEWHERIFSSENMKGADHFGYLSVDERIIFKCVSKKLLGNART